MHTVASIPLVILVCLSLNTVPAETFEKILDKSKIDGVDTHDLDIFIEKRVRYLHAKVDLKPAILGLLTLDKCVKQLAKGPSDTLESTLIKSLEKRVDRISARLVRLSGKDYLSSRDKRSIEFIGDLISDIFGNPGPADWKKVNSNILALESALKRVEDNVDINHNDIDTDRHVIEQHNREIKTLSLALNRNQNELSNINTEMKILRTFFEISTIADTLDSVTLALLEIKNNGMMGICSDRAIDKEFLIENVQNMEANKAGISPIFGSWEWRNYYRYEMCTIAMSKEALWVTIRIPLVKKSDLLIRAIPSFSLKKAIDRAELYGIKTVLFKEKESDQYHLMTQSTFDLCNTLGNTRTCGTRDSRFNSQSAVITLEFMLDRFLIISSNLASIKITEKCPNLVREVTLDLDSVILTPVNCSYSANTFTIDTREADVEITKEIGIVSIDKLEINKIENYHDNVSRIFIEEIANRSSSHALEKSKKEFEKNKKDINAELNSIDTKHESSWASYNLEKWILTGGVVCLALFFVLAKIRSSFVSKRIRTSTFNEIAELRTNLRLTQNEFRQETLCLQELNAENLAITNEINETDHSLNRVSNNCDLTSKTLSFSSPLNRSQFL